MKDGVRLDQRVEARAFESRTPILIFGFVVCAAILASRITPDPAQAHYVLQEGLINYADGLVRRGLSGAVSILLRDTFGWVLAGWAWAILALTGAAVTWLCVSLYARLPDQPALVVLVLAPWGLLFMAYSEQAAFRKEIFGYLAVALVLRGVLAGRGRHAVWWLAAGVAAMAVAVLMHEANVLLAPVFLLAVGMMPATYAAQARAIVGITAVGGLWVLAIAYAVVGADQPDIVRLCGAVEIAVCPVSFEWLTRTTAQGWRTVVYEKSLLDVGVSAVQIALAVLVLAGLRWQGARMSGRALALVIGLVALHLVSVGALFVVAIDWGRWVQMIAFPLGLLACTGVAAGLLRYERLLPAWAALIYIGSWSVNMINPEPDWNAVFIWLPLTAAVGLGKLVRWYRKTRGSAGAQRTSGG